MNDELINHVENILSIFHKCHQNVSEMLVNIYDQQHSNDLNKLEFSNKFGKWKWKYGKLIESFFWENARNGFFKTRKISFKTIQEIVKNGKSQTTKENAILQSTDRAF